MKKGCWGGTVVAFVWLAAFLAGCGGGESFDRVPLSGTVTFDGDGSRSGSLTVFPDLQGGNAEGPTARTIITNGKFSFAEGQGPAAGSNVFEINLTVPGETEGGGETSPDYAHETGETYVEFKKILDIPEGGSDSFAIEVSASDQSVEGEDPLPPSGER